MRLFRKRSESSRAKLNNLHPNHTIISFLIAVALAAPQAKPACSPQINQLAAGIQRNIEAQRGESASVQQIGQLIQSSPTERVPVEQFEPAKTRLLQFVNDGIQIRVANQQLAQQTGSRAAAGLAKVEMAQQTELQLSQGLSGNKVRDLATVQSLGEMFAGGTQQNMQNLAEATADCTPSPA